MPGKEQEVSTKTGAARDRERLSQGSTTVLNTAASLTPRLIREHPEITELYRDGTLTQTEIAQRVAPDVAVPFPSAGRAAVGNALAELMPREERKRIASGKSRHSLTTYMESLGEEGRKTHQKATSKARYEKTPANNEASIRARGITPWTEHERSYARFLSTQPDYQYPNGSHKGLPIITKIADALNSAFHKGNSMRDKDSIRGFLNNVRKKAKATSTA